MKILLLTHRVPYPPNRGDRIRSYNLLRFLAQRADIHLGCVSDEPVSDETVLHLNELCREVTVAQTTRQGRAARSAWSLACSRSATEGHFHSPELAQAVNNWLRRESFDAVIAYCSSMVPYALPAITTKTPVFVDLVDVDSQKWQEYADAAAPPSKWLYQLEAQRVRNLERELSERCQAVTVVSELEADLLRRHSPDANVRAIPNGVDLEYFRPVDAAAANLSKTDNSPSCNCVFVGALDYGANIDGLTWFIGEAWPAIIARLPQARLAIVGRNPPPAVQALATLPGIDLVGEVPDVRPHLHAADIVLAPLRIARGIQNKVLEALAAGKPVIASPQAIAGLSAVPGEHLHEATSPADWLTKIEALAIDKNERQRLAAAGRAFVCEHHRWDTCLQPWEELLKLNSKTNTKVPRPTELANSR